MKKLKLSLIMIAWSLILEAQSKPPAPSKMQMGKDLYTQHCLSCHQADGTGIQNVTPPLSKTSYVTGSKTTLVKIILDGMDKKIEVNGSVYETPMPAQSYLTDNEISSILTYVRNSFGNKASEVTSEEIKKIRASSK